MNSKELHCPIESAPLVALRELLALTNENNDDQYGVQDVVGVTITKQLIPTKANIVKTDLRKFKVVHPFEFIYNPRTHGKKIGLAVNTTNKNCIVSWNNETFKVKDEKQLLPLYLYLLLSREEWDREACFKSWGSSTEVLSWTELCLMKIPLPPIEVQRAYVDAYKGLTALIEENEALLKSLEATAQACVAECRNEWPMTELSSLITEINDRNIDGALSEINARGVNTDKQIQKAKRLGENLTTYKIVHKNNLVFNPNIKISKSGEKFAVAINKEEDCIVSNFYVVMQTSEKLIPEYLYLWLIREDFARYMRFISCSSVRESFGFDDMCRVKIPLPPIEVQRAIVALYHCAEEARKIAKEAKEQLAQVCPAMIQRASVIKKV